MIDLLTSTGLVRRWTLINGEARCIDDAISPTHDEASIAYGRSIYIKDLLERDQAANAEIDSDVAALRAVRNGPQSDEDEKYNYALEALNEYIENAPPVTAPIKAPMIISDRQFSELLWRRGIIEGHEHLAFVKTGTLPKTLQTFVNAIEDEETRIQVEGLISGAKEFRRDHPLVPIIGAPFKLDAHGLDIFWTEAAAL